MCTAERCTRTSSARGCCDGSSWPADCSARVTALCRLETTALLSVLSTPSQQHGQLQSVGGSNDKHLLLLPSFEVPVASLDC